MTSLIGLYYMEFWFNDHAFYLQRESIYHSGHFTREHRTDDKREVTKCLSIFNIKTYPCILFLISEKQLIVTTPVIMNQLEDIQLLMEDF